MPHLPTVKCLYFVFSEIDDIETGLLIEVWDKGMLWDKAIGYFWAPLQSLQFSAVVSKISTALFLQKFFQLRNLSY